MSARCDYFFRQRVSEAELDLGFELLEQADRNLAADLGVFGVISGAVPSPHAPVANLSIDLTAPGRAYDHLGQRIFFGTGQTVNCAVDVTGIPTDVGSSGSERWLGVFLRFRRLLSDPRTDGNSQQVYFRRDESFEIVVRQGAQGPIGSAPKPALVEDELLVCDVRRRAGQTQILAADIDISRRQAFVFTQGTSTGVNPALWAILQPAAATAQAAFDETDAELQAHFSGTARRHSATAIESAAHGFVAATNVQAAINELVDDLTSTADTTSGARRIGAEGVVGLANVLSPGSVQSQLVELLGFINAHAAAGEGVHLASAISLGSGVTGLDATEVMRALAEIISAFDRDHFRGNESTPGRHKVIEQPAFGSGRVLIWDAAGNGSTGSRMRVYLADDGVMIVFNASWATSSWFKDTAGAASGGLRICSTGIEVLYNGTSGNTFSSWTRTLRLALDNTNLQTAFEATGHVTEMGRCGARFRNAESAQRNMLGGNCVTFRSRMPAVPSSVTLTVLTSSSPVPSVWAENITNDGFAFAMTANNLPAGSEANWSGTYNVYA